MPRGRDNSPPCQTGHRIHHAKAFISVRETGLRYADNVRFDLEFYELAVSDFTIRNKHQVFHKTF